MNADIIGGAQGPGPGTEQDPVVVKLPHQRANLCTVGTRKVADVRRRIPDGMLQLAFFPSFLQQPINVHYCVHYMIIYSQLLANG